MNLTVYTYNESQIDSESVRITFLTDGRVGSCWISLLAPVYKLCIPSHESLAPHPAASAHNLLEYSLNILGIDALIIRVFIDPIAVKLPRIRPAKLGNKQCSLARQILRFSRPSGLQLELLQMFPIVS